MASVTMAAAATAGASLLPTNMTKVQAAGGSCSKRGFATVVAKAAGSSDVSIELKRKEESNSNGRRELVFAAAAAAACSVANVAMADEPERGSLEAKKKYAPICVTMPTARICRK